MPITKPLATVTNYYLNPVNQPRLAPEAKKQLLLLLVALSGVGLYVTPADQYAQRKSGDNIGMRINYIIGTCTPALMVLYNATDFFLVMRASDSIPAPLADLLKSHLTATQQRFQDIAITIGSAISSIPLTIISLAYPIPGLPQVVSILQAVAVQLDNTVLHFLPIKLAFSNPLYRVPALPLEYIYHKYQNRHQNREQKLVAEQMKVTGMHYQSLKKRLIDTLTGVQKAVQLKGLSFSVRRMGYEVTLPNNIVDIAKGSDAEDGMKILLDLVSYQLPGFTLPTSPTLFQKSMSKIMYGAGATLVISSCVGYLASIVTALTAYTESDILGGVLSLPSMYFLSVLFAYFGGNTGQSFYNYLTSWSRDDIKIPLEFKLYPVTTILLIAFVGYVAPFSYAAANELIENSFADEKWDDVRPVLLVLAEIGVPFLSISAMKDFYVSLLNKFAYYFGNSDEQMIIQLMNMIESLKGGIQKMSNVRFLESLIHMHPDNLKLLTHYEKHEFDEYIEACFKQDIIAIEVGIEKADRESIVTEIIVSEEDKNNAVNGENNKLLFPSRISPTSSRNGIFSSGIRSRSSSQEKEYSEFTIAPQM
jgi:hypothetical protein